MLFIDSAWEAVLKNNGLGNFSAIWAVFLHLVDEGNKGRGGFSVVGRKDVLFQNNTIETLYIKRQENYRCFSWKAPFTGIPTLQREFTNWQRCQKNGIHTYELVYFATQKIKATQRAILITKALPAIPLTEWIQNPAVIQGYCATQRFKVTRACAHLVRHTHDAHLCHGHLMPAHIFVSNETMPEAYLIDLENMKPYYIKHFATLKDLRKLARHANGASLTDKMRFLKSYLKISRLNPKAKTLWKKISALAH